MDQNAEYSVGDYRIEAFVSKRHAELAYPKIKLHVKMSQCNSMGGGGKDTFASAIYFPT